MDVNVLRKHCVQVCEDSGKRVGMYFCRSMLVEYMILLSPGPYPLSILPNVQLETSSSAPDTFSEMVFLPFANENV